MCRCRKDPCQMISQHPNLCHQLCAAPWITVTTCTFYDCSTSWAVLSVAFLQRLCLSFCIYHIQLGTRCREGIWQSFYRYRHVSFKYFRSVFQFIFLTNIAETEKWNKQTFTKSLKWLWSLSGGVFLWLMSPRASAALVEVSGLSNQWLLRWGGTLATGLLAAKQQEYWDRGDSQLQYRWQSCM